MRERWSVQGQEPKRWLATRIFFSDIYRKNVDRNSSFSRFPFPSLSPPYSVWLYCSAYRRYFSLSRSVCTERTRDGRIESMDGGNHVLHFSSSRLVLIETPISLSSHRHLCARLEFYTDREIKRVGKRGREKKALLRHIVHWWGAFLSRSFEDKPLFLFLSFSSSLSRSIVNWSEEQC